MCEINAKNKNYLFSTCLKNALLTCLLNSFINATLKMPIVSLQLSCLKNKRHGIIFFIFCLLFIGAQSSNLKGGAFFLKSHEYSGNLRIDSSFPCTKVRQKGVNVKRCSFEISAFVYDAALLHYCLVKSRILHAACLPSCEVQLLTISLPHIDQAMTLSSLGQRDCGAHEFISLG